MQQHSFVIWHNFIIFFPRLLSYMSYKNYFFQKQAYNSGILMLVNCIVQTLLEYWILCT